LIDPVFECKLCVLHTIYIRLLADTSLEQGHQIFTAMDGKVDHIAQQCSPCGQNTYILNSSDPNLNCQTCPVGAICNESYFASRVPGSLWNPDFSTGVWLLQSCPPGYELLNTAGSPAQFSQSNQQCSLCPAMAYCVGGNEHFNACPSDTFSFPGSNVSTACMPAVFVEISVLLPMRKIEFTVEKKELYMQALAAACNTVRERVRILRLDSGDRLTGNSVLILSDIAALDSNAAEMINSRANTANLNQQLAEKGLPQGALTSVKVLSSSGQGNSAMIIGVSIAGIIGLVLTVMGVISLKRKVPESEDEKAFRLKMSELRDLFCISPSHGFFFSAEHLPMGTRRERIHFLHKSWLEAAARLGLLQDFEVQHFDALSTCLEGHSKQKEALSTWVLNIAIFLIRPNILINSSGEGLGGGLGNLTLNERFDFFLRKVSKCNIWTYSGGGLFVQLKSMARELMDEVATLCDLRTEDLLREPGGEDLMALETIDYGDWQQALPEQISRTMSTIVTR
jgi:hypothetical protein